MKPTCLEAYWITPPFLSDLSLEAFQATLQAVFNAHTIQRACLRSALAQDAMLDLFAQTCHAHRAISYLNLATLDLSIQKALEHGFMGVHVKGAEILNIPAIPPSLRGFYSAHNALEVQKALDLGIEYCTLSPILATPHKSPPLGLEYLNQFPLEIKARLFALGGITTTKSISCLQKMQVKGFASVRYFTALVCS